jgi:hypothetical protein
MRDAIDRLFAPLAAVVRREPVPLRGAWSFSTRRAYAAASQLGTGDGPFVEIADACWRGTFESPTPLVGLMILCTATEARWAKSEPARANPAVEVRLTGAGGFARPTATFSACLSGGFTVGIPVSAAEDLVESCRVNTAAVEAGRPHALAEVADTVLVVVLIPSAAVEVGRCRLWRLRRRFARGLPPPLAEVLTRRRAGTLVCAGGGGSEPIAR